MKTIQENVLPALLDGNQEEAKENVKSMLSSERAALACAANRLVVLCERG